MSKRKSIGRPKTSEVWKYYKHHSETNSCECLVGGATDVCGKRISGRNSTNLKAHLQAFHKETYSELKEQEAALLSSNSELKEKEAALLSSDSELKEKEAVLLSPKKHALTRQGPSGSSGSVATSSLTTTSTVVKTLLEDEDEGDSNSSFDQIESTSNMPDLASSLPFRRAKRSLCKLSACISLAASSETSGVDVDSQRDELCTVPSGVSEYGTGSSLKRRKRRHPMPKNGEELLNAWLLSEIETNTGKKELMKSQIELNRSQTELNEVLMQESLLRIKDLQAYIK